MALHKNIKVLGIHSSPVKAGNVAHLLAHALNETAKMEDVET